MRIGQLWHVAQSMAELCFVHSALMPGCDMAMSLSEPPMSVARHAGSLLNEPDNGSHNRETDR